MKSFRKFSSDKTTILIPLVCSLLLSGCHDVSDDTKMGDEAKAPFHICNNDISYLDFYTLIDGNMVVALEQQKKASSSAEMAVNLVSMLILNGIDFNNLEYTVSFNNGSYTASNGKTSLSFKLYYEKDGAGYSKGDIIPHNVFSPNSYILNPDVDDASVLTGNPKYTYDKGPLFDFINGDIDFNLTISGISFLLKLKGEQIGFEVCSEQTYSGMPPRIHDELHLKLTSTSSTLSSVLSSIHNGGYGFDLDGTLYNSSFYELNQTFGESKHFITKASEGYIWKGTYRSKIAKEGKSFYQYGYSSTQGENATDYFCDSTLTDQIGTATHDSSLLGGTFEFTDGVTFPYGIQDFQ